MKTLTQATSLFDGATLAQSSLFGPGIQPASVQPATALLPACTTIINVIEQARDEEAPQRLSQLVEQAATWFSDSNREEARRHVAGAAIACQKRLPQQIAWYKEKLIDLCTKDLADRTAWLASYQLNFPEFRYCYPSRVPPALRTFAVPIETWGWQELQWVYYRIEQFAEMIPPHALAAMTVLDEAKIVPQLYWIADKVEVVRPRVSLDPVLVCNFGRWFVGIAQWD